MEQDKSNCSSDGIKSFFSKKSSACFQGGLPKLNSKRAKSDGANMTDFVPLFNTPLNQQSRRQRAKVLPMY